MGSRLPLRTLTLAAVPVGVGLLTLAALQVVGTAATAGPEAYAQVVLGLAVLSSVASVVLPRMGARSGSLRRSMVVTVTVAMGVTALTVTLSTAVMFLPPVEVRVLVILFLFGTALGIILEVAVAGHLSDDLLRLQVTLRRLATGDYGARAQLDREDEVGEASRSIDAMAARLASMDDERARAQASRRAFLTAVGHDLRTPLAALRAGLEALEDRLAPDPRRYYAAMHHDLDAITSLVDDLFLLARLEDSAVTLERVPLDLSELADEAVEALSPTARQRGVRLHLDTAGPVQAVGAPAELSRAIRNLLDNAIRHSPANGEVVVQVIASDEAIVRVVDQRPGFPLGDGRALFEGVVRSSPADGRTAGGAGLGLAIAKRLIDAHRGGIWIESGSGGRIAFSVPRDRGGDTPAT